MFKKNVSEQVAKTVHVMKQYVLVFQGQSRQSIVQDNLANFFYLAIFKMRKCRLRFYLFKVFRLKSNHNILSYKVHRKKKSKMKTIQWMTTSEKKTTVKHSQYLRYPVNKHRMTRSHQRKEISSKSQKKNLFLPNVFA